MQYFQKQLSRDVGGGGDTVLLFQIEHKNKETFLLAVNWVLPEPNQWLNIWQGLGFLFIGLLVDSSRIIGAKNVEALVRLFRNFAKNTKWGRRKLALSLKISKQEAILSACNLIKIPRFSSIVMIAYLDAD